MCVRVRTYTDVVMVRVTNEILLQLAVVLGEVDSHVLFIHRVHEDAGTRKEMCV